MREKLAEIIEYLKHKKVDYADIRFVETKTESITVKNNRLEELARNDNRGIGIRILHNGCWGFAACSELTKSSLKKTAEKALRIARASAVTNKEMVRLAPVEIFRTSYVSPCRVDPFAVPLDEKIDMLIAVNRVLTKNPKIKMAEAGLDFFHTEKLFCSTEGAIIEQTIIESGGGYDVTAVDKGEVQRRSYPNSHRGDYACAGYEFVDEMKFMENAERVADEALALLEAPPCPSGKFDIIITGSQLALQVHESCGHPVELDRVLGTEISLAGGSFLTTDKLGKYRYGSPIVNIVADSTIPGALGSFGYDDEGVAASRTDIIKEGIFAGYLSSRETTSTINIPPTGVMRADGWNRIPLIRMTNINLEPGNWEYDDLLADTEDGIILDSNKSWSIDDKRLNFQFGVEAAWRVKKGRITTMYKNPVYSGITPEFWNSCDAICNRDHWRIWGLPSCGKGEPMQTAHVAHGTAPARFRKVEVGVGR
ncbi:MAG: TldD/PmbA family protein [candidate division Zixibacteria bacterium]